MGLGIGIGNAMLFTSMVKGGIPLSPLVLAYILRVEADGGVVESSECIDENL